MLFPDVIWCKNMKNTLRISSRLIVSQILVFIIYSSGKGNLMFCCTVSWQIILGQSVSKIIIILSLRVSTSKIKIEIEKHAILKATLSVHSVIQWCQVYEIFYFYLLYFNPYQRKNKWWKGKFLCAKSVLFKFAKN